MRIVIQRVARASVAIGGEISASIGKGMLILLGIEEADGREDVDFLCRKASQLRIFDDEQGVMNESVADQDGEVLVVSQFTLYAGTKKGNRPSYVKAARPEVAIPLYEAFCRQLSDRLGREVQTGEFGANMQVELINDGPVTLLIDSKNRE